MLTLVTGKPSFFYSYSHDSDSWLTGARGHRPCTSRPRAPRPPVFRVSGLRFYVLGFRVEGLGYEVQGLGFRVYGLRYRFRGFGIEGSEFRV